MFLWRFCFVYLKNRHYSWKEAYFGKEEMFDLVTVGGRT